MFSPSSSNAPLLRSNDNDESFHLRSPRRHSLREAIRVFQRARNRTGLMMREPSEQVDDDRQSNWAYSKPVVIIDLVWNFMYIFAAIFVLVLSRREDPEVPLRIWIIGYSLLCLLHVVCVLLEYRRRGHGQSPFAGEAFGSPSEGSSGSSGYVTLAELTPERTRYVLKEFGIPILFFKYLRTMNFSPSPERRLGALLRGRPIIHRVSKLETTKFSCIGIYFCYIWKLKSLLQCCVAYFCFLCLSPLVVGRIIYIFKLRHCKDFNYAMLVCITFFVFGIKNVNSHLTKYMDSANTMLSFFWWIIGFYWVCTGGQLMVEESPQLYWLCIVFLAFDVFFMVFLLVMACAIGLGICCCLPCIIAVLYAVADKKGADKEDVEQLSKYIFRHNGCIENCTGEIQGTFAGFITLCGRDTPMDERSLSVDDAECSICLSTYDDGDELRELPCRHLFHCTCIDKWLYMSATCPLCKRSITGASNCCEEV